jgi:hypothetical protein
MLSCDVLDDLTRGTIHPSPFCAVNFGFTFQMPFMAFHEILKRLQQSYRVTENVFCNDIESFEYAFRTIYW